MRLPKYVQDMLTGGRIQQAPLDEQAGVYDEGRGEYGYMFRVYRRNNSQHAAVFVAEVDRLMAWATREYACVELHKYCWFSDKEHRKPYYRMDYALITITDPVAYQFEKTIKLAKTENLL